MSRTKPILYLPCRPLLVPCDYVPKRDAKVEYHQFTFTVLWKDARSQFDSPCYFERKVEVQR